MAALASGDPRAVRHVLVQPGFAVTNIASDHKLASLITLYLVRAHFPSLCPLRLLT
jgi:hypothetical protein